MSRSIIDKLDISITLPSGTEKDGAVGECEEIVRLHILPVLERVLSGSGKDGIEAVSLEINLGKVFIWDLAQRLESELLRILSGLSVPGGDAVELRLSRFHDFLAGFDSMGGEVPYVTGPGVSSVGSEGPPESTGRVNDDVNVNEHEHEHEGEGEGEGEGDSIRDDIASDRISFVDFSKDRELLSEAVNAVLGDRRIFYRLVASMDLVHLSGFVVSLADHLHVDDHRREFLRYVADVAAGAVVSKVRLPEGQLTTPKHQFTRSGSGGRLRLSGLLPERELHDTLSSFAESILFGETALPGWKHEFSSEDTHIVSKEFKLRKDIFLEEAVRMEDEPSQIGRLLVDDAGVMLLSPFFSSLFSNLGYLDAAGMFKSLAHRIRGVHILRCISCGFAERHSEKELVLSKVICGLSPYFPLERRYRIMKREREEVEGMLSAALGYWSVLKGTSPDGLRRAFLLRSGSLEKDGRGWLVRVEGKSIDILIGEIPWGFSTFVPTWTETGIFTEWQKESEL